MRAALNSLPPVYLAGPDVFFPEDFGGIDNLMITQSVIAICTTFEEAATALKRFLDQSLEVHDFQSPLLTRCCNGAESVKETEPAISSHDTVQARPVLRE
jgi:hypothetical protein